MATSESIVYLCNVVTDPLKKQRRLRGDSPAATKKVLDSCKALTNNGVSVKALSMGRGRVHGSVFFNGSTEESNDGVDIIDAAYLNMRLVTYIVTAFSLAACLLSIKSGSNRTLFVYNRVWLYLPTLISARVIGYRCILDVEDDDSPSGSRFSTVKVAFLKAIFNTLCNSGSVVINSKLLADIPEGQRSLLYYGSAGKEPLRQNKFLETPYTVLLSGSLMVETGVGLFIDAVNLIERDYIDLSKKLRFVVTGDGPMADQLRSLQATRGDLDLTYKGMVSFVAYQEIVRQADIGLCLKQADNIMGQTTFPSKVIEYVSHSLLLVSTRVSDVEQLFSKHNVYFLENENAETLVRVFQAIVTEAELNRQSVSRAHTELYAQLSEEAAGKILGDFLLCRA